MQLKSVNIEHSDFPGNLLDKITDIFSSISDTEYIIYTLFIVNLADSSFYTVPRANSKLRKRDSCC